MQVQRLESSRVWLLLLALSVVLALAWIGWAFGDTVPVYAHSEKIDVRPNAMAEATHVETRGNITQVGLRRVRELDVRFPHSVVAERLLDRPARVHLRGSAGVETVTGVITAVETDDDGELVARVRVELDGDADDPFVDAEPERVRVEVGTSAPVELWFPELARLGWPYRERGP